MKNYFAILSLSLLYACASPIYKPFPIEAGSKIKNSDVVLGVAQKEIIGEILPAGPAGGGILGAIIEVSINASRATAAEAAIVPVRDQLLNFNAEEHLQGAVKRLVMPISWVGNGSLALSKIVTVAEYDKRLTASEKNAVLILTVAYSLSPDFKNVKVYCTANLFPNTDELRKMQFDLYRSNSTINQADAIKTSMFNALYHNTLTYSKPLDVTVTDLNGAAAAWAANNGSKVNAALNEGVEAIVAMLALDLQTQNNLSAPGKKVEGKVESYQVTVAGQSLDVVRSEKGTMSATGKN